MWWHVIQDMNHELLNLLNVMIILNILIKFVQFDLDLLWFFKNFAKIVKDWILENGHDRWEIVSTMCKNSCVRICLELRTQRKCEIEDWWRRRWWIRILIFFQDFFDNMKSQIKYSDTSIHKQKREIKWLDEMNN